MKKTSTRVEMSDKDVIAMLLKAIRWAEILKVANGRDYAAQLTGKSRRTIDAYVAPSEDRRIPVDDLQKITFDVCRRMATAHQYPLMAFEVFDAFEQPVARSMSLVGAMFLADAEDGYFEADAAVWRGPHNHIAKPDAVLRSQLRRVMRSGKVSIEQACSVLGCCSYTLLSYQLECPFDPLSPPEFGVRFLQALVADQIGEAA